MIQKTIHIDSVESKEKKIILLDGKTKYNFWRSKKDGTQTKAEEQFQKFRFIAGDTVDAMVEETPESFVNEKGKKIDFVDRKIAYFMVQDNMPTKTISSPDAPQSPQTSETPQTNTRVATPNLQGLETRIRELEERVLKLETGDKYIPIAEDIVPNDIDVSKIPF